MTYSTMAMSDLPRDLVEEVLSRLPVTSMRAVRSTCKKWNIISKEESFTKKHVAQANAAAREMLCITNEGNSRLVVWNPYCGQTRWIEPRNSYHRFDNYALGYEKKNKSCLQYKILRILVTSLHKLHPIYEIEIYNFNSDSWKVVDFTPDGNRHFLVHGVSLKGNTYWLAREYVRYEGVQEEMNYVASFLICFDFTTERFGPRLPLPFDISIIDNVSLSSVREEQLVVLHHQCMIFRMEIWVSNKIEPNAVSWRKLLEVNMRPFPRYQFLLDHGSFFIDEKNKVVVVLDKDKETKTRNLAYFIGEDGYFKEVELGESRDKNGYPFVCSYVPSSVQFNFSFVFPTMSSKGLKSQKSTKRKVTESSDKFDSLKSKKPKLVSGEQQQQHGKPKFVKPKSFGDKEQSTNLSKKERRVQAKELTEARKKKRKPHYNLEQELASLWEKMRRRDIGKEDRSKLISEAIRKMKGKVPEIAVSHVSSRVLQTCVKFCSQAEKDVLFGELQPQFLNLASNKYAVHFIQKMLDGASKQQLAACISSLRGHVAPLLRHVFGSV
ncbi:Pumilio RNA-binding repeat, partial [Arabidopsis suecica]